MKRACLMSLARLRAAEASVRASGWARWRARAAAGLIQIGWLRWREWRAMRGYR